MQTTTYSETLPNPSSKRIKNKQEFVEKLKKAIAKNKMIGSALGETTIHASGAHKTGLLERFVKGIDESYKNSINSKILSDMLVEAKQDLKRLKEKSGRRDQKRIKHVIKTLTIIYRNGLIRPNTFPTARLNKYHWELQTKFEAWVQIGEKGQMSVKPQEASGQVRLVYNDDPPVISNVVDLASVIKRQSGAAKRKPYTFGTQDREFIARCQGVAGRILRLTQPRLQGPFPSSANRFSMRVFQDRVSRLPEHLNKGIAEIVELCEHSLSSRTRKQKDDDYIKMIEFVEPTIHLNPEGRRRDLKAIASGSKIRLILAAVGPNSTRSDNRNNAAETTDDSEDSLSDSSEEDSQEDSGDDSGDDSQDDSQDDSPDVLGFVFEPYSESQVRSAAAGKTITRGGLNDTEITEILDTNNISIDGSAKDRRGRLTKLVDGSLKPGQAQEDSQKDSDSGEDSLSDSGEDSGEDEEIPSGLDYVEWGQAVGKYNAETLPDLTPAERRAKKSADWNAYKAAEPDEDEETDASSVGGSTDQEESGGEQEQSEEDGSDSSGSYAFKVGDNVRITRSGNYTGRIGKIVKKTTLKWAVIIDGNTKLYVGDDEMELISVPSADSDEEQKEEETPIPDDVLAELREAFDKYDVDGSGRISLEELRRGYEQAGEDPEEAFAALQTNDSNADGEIDFDEFARWSFDTNALDVWKRAQEPEESKSDVLDRFEPFGYELDAIINAALGATLKKKNNAPGFGLNKGDIVKILAANHEDTDGDRAELEERLTELLERFELFTTEIASESDEDAVSEEEESEADDGQTDSAGEYVAPSVFNDDGISKDKIVNALQGKTKSNGGLNKGKIVKLLEINGQDTTGDRDDVQERLKEYVLEIDPAYLDGAFESEADSDEDLMSDADAEALAAMAAERREERDQFTPMRPGPSDLSHLVAAMSDDWASSEDELNFAEDSEMDSKTSSGLEFAESSAASGAGSSGPGSSGPEFAESSAAETDSDIEFAESSAVGSSAVDIGSSALEFAESSAGESDVSKDKNSSSGLDFAESSDYD